jgi:hypothetical protein
MEFDRYSVRIETKEARGLEESPRTRPVWDLVRDPHPLHLAELLWRLGLPLAALNLAVLAIPLAFVNPRAGRTNNLDFCLPYLHDLQQPAQRQPGLGCAGKASVRHRRLGRARWHVPAAGDLVLPAAEPLAWGRLKWR